MSARVGQRLVRAADGFELAATEYGDAQSARAAVLVVPAMGVEQRYYAPFASWLADRYAVVTFDYRGIGQSRPAAGSLRGFAADVLTWATRDAPALVDFAAGRAPGRPLLWVGHSLGGQILGLVPNRHRVSAMATVACGSGYWLDHRAALRATVWWLWFVAVPLSLRLCGYFPGRRLRKIGDVPPGAMRQWRRWCLHPDYLVGVEGETVRRDYAALTQPILSLSFTDDEYMSARNIASLHSFYAGAPREMRRLAPAEIGEKRIGHFGFFRRRPGEKLWPLAGEWLDRFATGGAQRPDGSGGASSGGAADPGGGMDQAKSGR